MTYVADNVTRILLRPQEAANSLGVSLRALMTWVSANEIPHVRLGARNLRFSIDALRTWVASRSTWPTAVSLGAEAARPTAAAGKVEAQRC